MRRYWVHPLNMKRPREGQFQIIFLNLRAYSVEFFKYYHTTIATFYELVSIFISLLTYHLIYKPYIIYRYYYIDYLLK